MKDLIKTPEIKPKKIIKPNIFVKPSSLNFTEDEFKELSKKIFLRFSDDKKDKIQEICKKLFGHRISKESIRYKTVQKLVAIQPKKVDNWGVKIIKGQLKQLSTLAEFKKEKSVTEYNFYKKLEIVFRTFFLEKGEPFWTRMFKSTGDTPHTIIHDLYKAGYQYVAGKEIPDIWKHCLLNDLDLFSEEENKKVVGIIGAFLNFRTIPEVQYI